VRVVLDTGVVVSALVFTRGRLAWLRNGWAQRDFVPLVSTPTVGELIRVLSYPKFQLTREEIEVLLAAYLPCAEVVRVTDNPPSGLPTCSDPADQDFLELAGAGGATFLVTGDRDLLELGDKTSLKFVTPASFRDLSTA
jgi:putative PIN family toxin of toxin-antitoxin system